MPHFFPVIKEPTDKELREVFKPLGRTELWLHNHLQLLWRIVYWNWFNVDTGEKGFYLFLRHGLREWREE
jgi:hypothetical protein